MFDSFKFATFRTVAFEGDGDGQPAQPAPAPQGSPAPAPEGKQTQFSQDDVNRMMAQARREGQAALQKAMDEVNALSAKVQLTSGERSELEARIETLNNQLLTKDELQKKEAAKAAKKYQDEIQALTADLDSWKHKYENATIIRALSDAAEKNQAYRTSQIIAILRDKTRLVEDLDQDGKPTGEMIPQVSFQDVDGNGNPVSLTLSPSEAVKRMQEMEEFANLFVTDGVGGFGGRSKPGTKKPNLADVAKDAAAYREARKNGQIPL